MSKTSPKILKSILSLRDRPPKTKEELDYYLRYFYKIFLAKIPIEETNSSPLDFVWDIYSTAMGFNPSPVYNILGMAARGSQKSLACAVIEALLIHHDKFRDLFHMASIKEQSYVTYDYFRTIMSREIMRGVTYGEPTMRETKSCHGTKIKIGTATLNSVNSFHGSVIQDELDLTPKKIFDESKGMLSAQQGHMPLNVYISSRKFALGNIQHLLNKAKEDKEYPLKIHQWSILEITEKCKPGRHGEHGEEIYVDDENLIAISKEEYEVDPSVNKEKFEKNIGYKNCLKCGIFSFCKGRLPKQVDDNSHLQPIELTKRLFKTDSPEFFASQRLNRKPSSIGLIYPMYDELVHVKSNSEMWEIFKGEPHPDTIKDKKTGRPKRWDISTKELLDTFIEDGCRIVVGVDFGFSILAVCGLFIISKSGKIFFIDELSYAGYTDREVAAELSRNWGHLPVEMVYADPASPGGKKEIRLATNWHVSNSVDKSVDPGIDSVRRFMRLPGTRESAFYVSQRCAVFREEVVNYRTKLDVKTQEPIRKVHKRNDHSLDQTRYVIHTIFGGINWDLNFNQQQSSIVSEFNAKSALRAPTATELATHLGRNFIDNRTDYQPDESGNLAKKDKPEDSVGGGAGFTWSF